MNPHQYLAPCLTKFAAGSAPGTFTGYGSVFGVVDSYNEVVAPGAFAESLARIKASGRALPVLWQHRAGEPVGVYQDLQEDAHGLRVQGKLAIDASVPRADEAHSLMKLGAVSGLSIGYFVREDSTDQKTGIRTLKKLDLVECSLVTFPANDAARVGGVKNYQSPRDLESALRDACGLSARQAKRLVAGGYAAMVRDEPSTGEAEEIAAALYRIIHS